MHWIKLSQDTDSWQARGISSLAANRLAYQEGLCSLG
jgi:hypothetical protein